MRKTVLRWSVNAVAAILASFLAWPAAGTAQILGDITGILPDTTTTSSESVAGRAQVVKSTVLGMTTVLADTGALTGTTDARDAALITGSIPSVLSGEVLHAVTVGWPDQVASEASLAGLGMTVGGTHISADFLMARAFSSSAASDSASSTIGNLRINGMPVWVSGSPNQRVWIPGGQVVLNEQTVSAAGTTVNALHATVFGLADVVVASATAGIQ
jgi:hypothetical protein